ncbi:MAG: VTT domain-containing protein [Rhodospirillum sp.]|nr:VTT domain-containing protein [Rhodospirillum sp.]MCF8487563.1 VTT domain-containing protein [Rhodospirillum sp.]MCF8499046.1 VTT domain-containing protein [Rhodospirillum sp.]
MSVDSDGQKPVGEDSPLTSPDALSVARKASGVWRLERADRCAILFNGEAYYAALRESIKTAQQSIFILAWELHSKIPLLRDVPLDSEGRAEDGWPVTLRSLLLEALERNPELEVRVVLWRAAVLFRLEREVSFNLPSVWSGHPRLRFVEDGDLPTLASHHQKVVTIDDRLAFAGGLDITGSRWDSAEHRVSDSRRTNPDGSEGGPWFDLQAVVDGDAARAIAELVRTRWSWATGETLDPPDPFPPDGASDSWPPSVTPQFRNQAVALSRTEHPHAGREAVREVEASFVEALENARNWILIAQQYCTSETIGNVLERRLAEEDGPEMVLIMPHGSDGPTQQAVMDTGRDSLLDRLRAVAPPGRLGVYWPLARDKDNDGGGTSPAASFKDRSTEEKPIYVHAKALIVDGTLLRVGSANLANRSMGLDTELDLTVEARDSSESRRTITGLAHRLCGELLGMESTHLKREVDRQGSWVAAIEALRDKPGNTLMPLTHRVPALYADLAPDPRLTDPDRPLDPDLVAALLVVDRDEVPPPPGPDDLKSRRLGRRAWLALGGGVALLTALAMVWTNPDVLAWIKPNHLVSLAGDWARGPFAPLLAILTIILLGLTGFPVLVIILTVGLLFDTWLALVINVVGVNASAALLFTLGTVLGRDAVERFGGRAIPALSKRLAKQGAATVAALRNLPIAPFTLVNLICGATHIRFRDYMLGTFLGMGPGIVALSVLGDHLANSLKDPDLATLAGLAGVALVTAGVAHLLQRWAEKRSEA